MIPASTMPPGVATDLLALDSSDMDLSFGELVYPRVDPALFFGNVTLDSVITPSSHLSYAPPELEPYNPLSPGDLDLSLLDNFLANSEQLLHPARNLPYGYDASGVAQSGSFFPAGTAVPTAAELDSPATLVLPSVVADPISHRHSAYVHSLSSSTLPYVAPQPQHITNIAALQTLATAAALTSAETPTPAAQSQPTATSSRDLTEAIRMPRMKVRVASSRTNPRRTGRASTSRYSPYSPSSRPSPDSPSSSASSPPSSDSDASSTCISTSSASTSTSERTSALPRRLTCPLPHCPSPTTTYGRPADLERHILAAGTHLLPSDAWACCGLPLAAARARGDVPQAVLAQTPREYYGIQMVGGCGRENSRKDALGRHLGRRKGVCWGERDGWWLVGNRRREACKAEAEVVVARSVGMWAEADGQGRAEMRTRNAQR